MSKKKPAGKEDQSPKILISGLNLTSVFKGRSVSLDAGLRTHFAELRRTVKHLERIHKALNETLKQLEGEDKLGNFEIQQLMSDYNQSETLASNLAKKMSDTMSCVINKI